MEKVEKNLTEMQTTCLKFSNSVLKLPGISGLVLKNEKIAQYFKDQAVEGSSDTFKACFRLRGCYEVISYMCNFFETKIQEFKTMDMNIKKLNAENMELKKQLGLTDLDLLNESKI